MRFKKIDLCTDDQFYEDTETGLLMVISGNIPPAEHEARLQRRSAALIERLAIKVKNILGRKPSKGDDWKLAIRVDELIDLPRITQRQAVGIVARELMARAGIATEKAARGRVNAALRQRRAAGAR